MSLGTPSLWKVAMAATVALVLSSSVALSHQPGWMTGGGSGFTRDGVRVTHGFVLQCVFPEGAEPTEPNNLQVNWQGNRFHLEELTRGECSDDDEIAPNPPGAAFDTYRGEGIGRYNGVDGATASWRFRDAGEPGVDDEFKISIQDADGHTVLFLDATVLDRGNHQAH
jgi:hypothetical protein